MTHQRLCGAIALERIDPLHSRIKMYFLAIEVKTAISQIPEVYKNGGCPLSQLQEFQSRSQTLPDKSSC